MSFRTQAKVDGLRLPAGKTEHWEFDSQCTGLSVRLQGKRRSWVVWYQANGKRRKVSIGNVEGMRLAQAREEATRIVQGARKGHDEAAERARAKAKSADTLKALIDVYLERRAKPHQKARSYVETERNLLKAWQPLHGHPVDGITRRDIAAQLERIRSESGPTAAKNARVYLSGCFSWAMRQGLADSNPTIGTEAPPQPASRARALRAREMASIWNSAGNDDFGRVVRLLMLTGQRRDEIAGMAWSELDLERRLWILPARRTKNGREHEVPLPAQALALLPERRPGRDLVFGRGDGPFSGFSRAKAALDRASGVQGWRLHDLRHSFVTNANEIGIEPHIIEAAINHVSGARGGIAGRYNAAQYREQKRTAMQRYADWLGRVVRGEPENNVVLMSANTGSL